MAVGIWREQLTLQHKYKTSFRKSRVMSLHYLSTNETSPVRTGRGHKVTVRCSCTYSYTHTTQRIWTNRKQACWGCLTLASCCLQSRLDSSLFMFEPVEFCTFVPTHLQVPDVSPSKRHGIKLLTVPEKHHETDLWWVTLRFDRHGNMNTQSHVLATALSKSPEVGNKYLLKRT